MDFDSGEGLYDEMFPSTPTQIQAAQQSRASESTSTPTSQPGSTTGKTSHLQLLEHVHCDRFVATF